MNLLLIGLSAMLALTGCSGEEPPPPPPPKPAPPPPPPPKPAVMGVAEINAARDANAGQSVKVKGMLTKVEKVDAPAGTTNLTVSASDAADADWVMCVNSDPAKQEDLLGLDLKQDITVMGMVDAAAMDGKTKLTGCAPTEPGRGKAKEGKGGDEGKAGKGGKAKGG